MSRLSRLPFYYGWVMVGVVFMTVMAGAVFFSVRFLLAAVPALALRFPIKKWAALAAVLNSPRDLTQMPAQLASAGTEWFLDQAARGAA